MGGKIGGERRSCTPIGLADPSVFETASAPRRIHSPMVPEAGVAPASVRLEGGGLSCSATRRKVAGPVGIAPTLFRVRSAADYLLPTGLKMALLPGLAPGPRPSHGRVMAFSPQEENWSPPPESHRPGPAYKAGTSLPTSDGRWSPRRDLHPRCPLERRVS